jgi:hypothetical protein
VLHEGQRPRDGSACSRSMSRPPSCSHWSSEVFDALHQKEPRSEARSHGVPPAKRVATPEDHVIPTEDDVAPSQRGAAPHLQRVGQPEQGHVRAKWETLLAGQDPFLLERGAARAEGPPLPAQHRVLEARRHPIRRTRGIAPPPNQPSSARTPWDSAIDPARRKKMILFSSKSRSGGHYSLRVESKPKQ